MPTSSSSIIVVMIPGRVAARWTGWQTIGRDSMGPEDPARDALFGDDGGRAAALARELGLPDATFSRWRHLASAAELLSRVSSLDHEATRGLLQLLGLLQPEAVEGTAPKLAALARLAHLTPAAGFADIRGLRGVPWRALPPAPALDDLLAGWARATMPDSLRTGDVVDAVADALVAGPDDAFQQALAAALRDAADQLVLSQVAEALLRHPRGADATRWLVRHVGSRSAVDGALAAAAAVGTAPEWVVGAAVHHQLPRTHASIVDTSDPVVAWQAHLSIVPREDVADAILAQRTRDAGTVRAALEIADAALTDRAGQLVAAQPTLLTGGDVADERFRAVWTAAIHHGADPWQYVSPAVAAAPLLALVAGDHPVDAVLLDALSQTSAADLAQHPDRAKLWDRLPPAAAARFKAATAAVLARGLRPSDPVPEPQLQAAILAPDVLGAVAHEDAGQAVALLRALPTARPDHASLVAVRGRFRPDDAADLARLVVERRWKRAAETIVDLSSSRPDLRLAAARVGQLFSTLERLRRYVWFSEGLRHLASADELRDALHDTAARLYPGGPTDDALWERAGGHDADLLQASTGRLRWGLALEAMMQGQRGAPMLSTLLEAMMTDYPNNDDLRVLAASLQEGKKN